MGGRCEGRSKTALPPAPGLPGRGLAGHEGRAPRVPLICKTRQRSDKRPKPQTLKNKAALPCFIDALPATICYEQHAC
jgi:hypothetical protein